MSGYRRAGDLPQVIPVFPLDGALLLPGGELPLRIFEPRYLNMVDDVMAGDRMIGMIQTTGGERARPNLAGVGCAGRITSFNETSDGTYLITLTGVCRFGVGDELPVIDVSAARWEAAVTSCAARPGSVDGVVACAGSTRRIVVGVA